MRRGTLRSYAGQIDFTHIQHICAFRNPLEPGGPLTARWNTQDSQELR